MCQHEGRGIVPSREEASRLGLVDAELCSADLAFSHHPLLDGHKKLDPVYALCNHNFALLYRQPELAGLHLLPRATQRTFFLSEVTEMYDTNTQCCRLAPNFLIPQYSFEV